MIFVARQLIEKTLEHNDSLFILFVDLRKAYDSVPRSALWKVLQKCGIPPTMLNIIKSFHNGMQASVRVVSSTSVSSSSFSVCNGLRQGCTLAPTLFNLYFNAMVSNWRSQCPQAGVELKYKHGRKLVGDRTAKSRLSTATCTESQFADDAALYTTSRAAFEDTTRTFVSEASRWRVTVSLQKTKGMAVGEDSENNDARAPISLENGTIEVIDNFPYLGSNLTKNGQLGCEIDARVAKAAKAFGCIRNSIFQNLSTPTKRKVYQATVLPILLYGAETWPTKAIHLKRLAGFHNHCVRTILGVSRYEQWTEHLSTVQMNEEFGMPGSIHEVVMKHRLRWLGHVARMNGDRMPKQILFGELKKTRPAHGTKKRWRDGVNEDLKSLGLQTDWYDKAQDRDEWAALCRGSLDSLLRTSSGARGSGQSSITPHSCSCGRVFRRQGDLTRHRRFCHSSNQST